MNFNNIDSSIRAEGAEVWVRGLLMVRFGIITSIASRNMPGYDIIAHSPNGEKNCKISVKYRRAENADGFIIKSDIHYDIFVGVWGCNGKVSGRDFYYGEDCATPRVFIMEKKSVDAHLKRKAPMSSINEVTILQLKTIKAQIPEAEDNWRCILNCLQVSDPESVR